MSILFLGPISHKNTSAIMSTLLWRWTWTSISGTRETQNRRLPCDTLTHLPQVPLVYASGNRVSIGSDNGLSPFRRQSIYLNQCWNIVNWTVRNKFQWNFDKKLHIFIQVNAFENVVCKIAESPEGKMRTRGYLRIFVNDHQRRAATGEYLTQKKWTPFSRRHFQMDFP